jgi:hypothetical protein
MYLYLFIYVFIYEIQIDPDRMTTTTGCRICQVNINILFDILWTVNRDLVA